MQPGADTVREGVAIFAATPSDQQAIESAKTFIADNCLTNEDVKMGNIGNTLIVVTKKEIKLLK